MLFQHPQSFTSFLTSSKQPTSSPYTPRQISDSHYTYVTPEKCPEPYLIASSSSCALLLGLDDDRGSSTPQFLDVFSGNESPISPSPSNRKGSGYCTVYGCHDVGTGSWSGQLGDGRMCTICEVVTTAKNEEVDRTKDSSDEEYVQTMIYDVQLKGSGRTPYCRGFDGRLTLRSAVREFLACEHNFHLGVETTRALSVIGRGEGVRRKWFKDLDVDADENESSGSGEDARKPVQVDVVEPAAVICRVAENFTRFGHLQILHSRKEYQNLSKLLNYTILRSLSFKSLSPPSIQALNLDINSGNIDVKNFIDETHDNMSLYIDLYRRIVTNSVKLVCSWLRVGYVQGNMQSDNLTISGITLDYGPFAYLEKFNLSFTTWIADGGKKSSFGNQGRVMGLQVEELGRTFKGLCGCSDEVVRGIGVDGYNTEFEIEYNDVKRRKLGFSSFGSDDDERVWKELEDLMTISECDYTIFFRELIGIGIGIGIGETVENALVVLKESLYIGCLTNELTSRWSSWFGSYIARIKKENNLDRVNIMSSANPIYILRNWISYLAYHAAENDDLTVLNEIQDVMSRPYDHQSECIKAKYYRKTPRWARGKGGTEVLSCSS